MSIFDNMFKEESISGLTPELKAIYTYNMFLNNEKNIIVITNSLYEANIFYQRLLNYTKKVLLFPMDDFLTSTAIAISPELEVTRLETMNILLQDKKNIVVTNLMGYLRFLPLRSQYENCKISLHTQQNINREEFLKKICNIGYKRESIVTKTGTVAVRGYIIDLFPLSESHPIRIELWGDNIDSIRYFDENTQLTLEKIDNIIISPCTEFLVDKEFDFFNYHDIAKYTKVTNILNYLGDYKLIWDNYNDIINGNNLLTEEINNYKKINNIENEQFMNLFSDIKVKEEFYLFDFDNQIDCVKNTKKYNSFEIDLFPNDIKEKNKILNNYLKNKKTIIICLSSKYQINKVIENIDNKNFVVTNENDIIKNKINLIVKNIISGYQYNDYVVISENELFNKKTTVTRYKSNFKLGTKIRDINKLNIGDYIVHSMYGIGKYKGLKTLLKNGLKKDYLSVEYKDGDKLYIPVEKIELISKFSSGDGAQPIINKLGGSEWQKTKLKVKKKLENIATDLIQLYAKRESSIGFAFNKDDENQLLFEQGFPFEETLDQLKVTEEIKKDMQSVKPMDRLLCGDVGFGKTEVAFRAMFKAVISGKQVAYLCPTTILSSQHYNNAIERFKNFPVRIELLNRFVSQSKIKVIIQDLKDGKIDIVIGTHRILSNDIVFKDLGLLVVDEEQRFGVTHKEKIKKLKNNIDVLTLSATPIPRTLQMSMMGIRSLSLLETPPTDRYPVQTYVLEENNNIIKDAIYKEITRGGQIFILYNSVQDIEIKKIELEQLVPTVKILVAHGQMNKNQLEDVMLKFINKEADILLCTTIIETGIDISSANTLIIMDADHFGLSQLYQIRGRVGRSNKIAYCYLMYNRGKILSDVAQKRLNVIKEFTELGSGFSIAMRDLSIRGAGDILGSEQAGFIDTVGIDLYLQMLDEEVKRAQGNVITEEKNISDRPFVEIETSIDDYFVEDQDLKIEIHRKINEIDSYESLVNIKSELEDRFGNINDNIIIYMYSQWLEKLAMHLNITNVRQTNNFIEIILPKSYNEKIDGMTLFSTVNKLSHNFRFSMKDDQIVITLDIVKLDKHFVYYLIDLLKIIDETVNKKSEN